ncbi:hypothetical protein SuNHUV7_15150 (plasmid) [Pseudoseohaeicola sp. NH-UV-7]|uniref:hypothetical protein n=1 Tax=Sulfitobacter sp. TBRI5 TaxID=2989732 RepID=UPI003A718DD9
MARIGARIAKLERNRPDPRACEQLDLDLPPDLCARIEDAKVAGTFPQSLSNDDLLAIKRAADLVQSHA